MSDFDNQENAGFDEGIEEVFQEVNEEQTYTDPTPEPEQKQSSVFAIISMICGILGVLCCCVGAIAIVLNVAAIVLAIVSFKKAEPLKGMAIAGVICGAVGLICAILMTVFSVALQNSSELMEQFIDAFPPEYQEQLRNSL